MLKIFRKLFLAFLASAFLVIFLEFVPFASFNMWTELLIGSCLFLSISFIYFVSIFLKGEESIKSILESKDHPLFPYLKEKVRNIHKNIIEKSRVEASIPPNDIDKVSHALFKSGKGRYVGVDSTLPSTYFEKYPNYLDYHKEYLKEEEEGGARVLIAKREWKIYDDSRKNMVPYKNFVKWHQKNGVDQLFIVQEKAEEIKNELGLESTDVGLWEDFFAVFFSPTDEYVNIKMAKKGSSEFEAAKKYIERILEEAKTLKLEFPVIPEKIADHWSEYVGDLSERNEKLGNLLLGELEEFKNFEGRIMDAAAGTGGDGIFLLENQFDVSFNEIDPELQKKLKNKLEEKGFDRKVFGVDWRSIGDELEGVYKGVLVLGNSLCMVKDEKERKKCLQEFYKMLAPGGKLIIDERNFPVIEEKVEEEGEYRRRRKILYNGDKVDFKVTKSDLNEDFFSFDFYSTEDESWLGKIVVDKLEEDELREALEDVGFEIEKVYSDLEEGREEDAEFYTYVAVKPS